MMEKRVPKIGEVVKNKNGHDKGYFAVVKFSGGFAYIADGRSRLLEKPKKKNPKHLILCDVVLEQESITTDKKLRAALWPYNFGPNGAAAFQRRYSLGKR